MPIAIEAPLMAPHGPADPHQFVGQGYRSLVVADARRRCHGPALQRKRSINPVLVDGVCFQEAKAEAGEQFHGSSAS